jgi:hypothetical protein
MSASETQLRSTLRFALGFFLGLVALFSAIATVTPIAMAAGDPVIHTESGPLQGTVGTQITEYSRFPTLLRPSELCAGGLRNILGDGVEFSRRPHSAASVRKSIPATRSWAMKIASSSTSTRRTGRRRSSPMGAR